jgi:hypothetical protein
MTELFRQGKGNLLTSALPIYYYSLALSPLAIYANPGPFDGLP